MRLGLPLQAEAVARVEPSGGVVGGDVEDDVAPPRLGVRHDTRQEQAAEPLAAPPGEERDVDEAHLAVGHVGRPEPSSFGAADEDRTVARLAEGRCPFAVLR